MIWAYCILAYILLHFAIVWPAWRDSIIMTDEHAPV